MIDMNQALLNKLASHRAVDCFDELADGSLTVYLLPGYFAHMETEFDARSIKSAFYILETQVEEVENS